MDEITVNDVLQLADAGMAFPINNGIIEPMIINDEKFLFLDELKEKI